MPVAASGVRFRAKGGLFVQQAAAAIALASLASCGGGSSGTPTPTNSAPTFSVGNQNIDVVENSTGTLFTAAASDPEGQAVSYSLSGPDAANFTINSAGEVTFAEVPNFDLPQDSDHNNSYDFNVTASDGIASSSISATVTVTNDKEGVSVSLLSHFDDTGIILGAATGNAGLVVVKPDGSLILLDPATGAQTAAASNAFNSGETGRVLAVTQVGSGIFLMLEIDGIGTVVRYRNAWNSRYSSPTTLLDASANSSAQGYLFYTAGSIYAALGDPDGTLAQDTASGFGKLFRLNFDPYCGASIYSVCLGNGIIGDGIHDPVGGFELFGKAVLFDRGTDKQDELDFFNQNASPLDFGWPYREGIIEREANPPAAVNGPFLGIDRGTAFGQTSGIVGGAPYTGAVASLADKLIFGDSSGKIFAAPSAFATDGTFHKGEEVEDRTADFQPTSGSLGEIRQIVKSGNGRVFIQNSNGDVFAVG